MASSHFLMASQCLKKNEKPVNSFTTTGALYSCAGLCSAASRNIFSVVACYREVLL